jgi:hypothetical protein
MGNTIASFRDKYDEYGVDPSPDHQGLTIGGFESAFLADPEASYIFDRRFTFWRFTSNLLGPAATMRS